MRYSIQMLPATFFYYLLPPKRKHILKRDINRVHTIEYQRKKVSYFTAFYRLMVDYPAFRNVFYHRMSYFGDIICWFLPKCKTLEIRTLLIGGYIQHGTSTQILATKIGKNFFVNQNVTIGWNGSGCPTIGDNVSIRTGAVVVGPITIGDNVNIGANAIVVKDVPSNTTVVSPHSFICKKDGKRVHEEL